MGILLSSIYRNATCNRCGWRNDWVFTIVMEYYLRPRTTLLSNEVGHCLKQGAVSLEQGGLSGRFCFGLLSLGALNSCGNFIKKYHAKEPFTESMQWPLLWFHTNGFYNDCRLCSLQWDIKQVNFFPKMLGGSK